MSYEVNVEWQVDQAIDNLDQTIDWLHSKKEQIVDCENLYFLMSRLELRADEIESLLEWLNDNMNPQNLAP